MRETKGTTSGMSVDSPRHLNIPNLGGQFFAEPSSQSMFIPARHLQNPLCLKEKSRVLTPSLGGLRI